MADYITVDGGTTNTRVSLVRQGKVVDTRKYAVGARAGIDGTEPLKSVIRDAISELLCENQLTEKDICRILASGMITSEYGLCRLDHIPAPAGIAELHAAMFETLIPDVCGIPFVFLRGVKRCGTTLEETDVMRGEETELFGLCNGERGVYVLPGSHSKIIETDALQRIVDFRTMMTGEMLASLSGHTILKSAVDLAINELDEGALCRGFTLCRERGINEALFKVRILQTAFCGRPCEIYSFFMGVVLCGEISFILSKAPPKITVGGRKQIKEAMVLLLGRYSKADVVAVSDADVQASTSLGMIKIFEYRG